MARFCGKRFRVYRRADKACDTIEWGKLRRMENAVHLENLRCDGGYHGGCQAGCLIYWKEAWLKRVPAPADQVVPVSSVRAASSNGTGEADGLVRLAQKGADDGEPVYSCQATELVRATSAELPWWKPGQYIRDIRSGNASSRRVARSLLIGFFNKFQQATARFLPRFALIQRGNEYPFLRGRWSGDPLGPPLDLQPGELVEVKTKEEILATLDDRDRTRGLRFDREMLQYCGRRGRVLRRVNRIIDEKTGKMLNINSDCIIIDGFICTGDLHRLCPRSIYTYWRECWLKRVEMPSSSADVSAPRNAEPAPVDA
jgi:hypothetical protein